MYVVFLKLNKNSNYQLFFTISDNYTETFQQHKFIISIINNIILLCCTYRSECSKFSDENNIDKKNIVTIEVIVKTNIVKTQGMLSCHE